MRKGRTRGAIGARLTAMCLWLLLALAAGLPAASAASGDRTLYLYYTHTKETGTFTFRKDGRYDPKVIAKLNYFLRDWRRNEPTKMDQALFDLLWLVYQDVHATQPINIISAYRAPATNELLRSKSSGVAKNSRHTMGMAMDFNIPGISLAKLREAAMKRQVGGVGYYPTSGSPFVHLDTGNVRAWPRMTRAQLERLFPDGETLHLPAEGNTPLNTQGYQVAKAQWTKCHTVPCSGATSSDSFAVAAADSGSNGGGKSLMDWIFGSGEADEGAADTPVPASPTPLVVASVAVTPPLPAARPAGFYSSGEALPFGLGSDPLVAAAAEVIPIPSARPAALLAPAFEESARFTVASIAAVPAQAPRQAAQPLPPLPLSALAPVLAGYAPSLAPEPDAQKALEMLLERRAAFRKSTPELNTAGLRSDLSAGVSDTSALSALIAGTLATVSPAPVDATALPDLVAPDLAHVADLLVDPNFFTSDHYAIIIARDEADLAAAIALSLAAPRLSLDGDPAFGLGRTAFARPVPGVVTLR